MPSLNKIIFFRNCTFKVEETVYEPAEDSFLFAENLSVKRGDYVLDIGTGCGLLAIVAATQDARVVAVDVNPCAARSARANARLNHVEDRILVVQGDLFAPLKKGERFNMILFNAPYLPAEHGECGSWLERAWAGGITGREVIDRFIQEAPAFLKPKGRILMMQSSLAGSNETLQAFKERGLKVRVLKKQDLPFFESLMLFEGRR